MEDREQAYSFALAEMANALRALRLQVKILWAVVALLAAMLLGVALDVL